MKNPVRTTLSGLYPTSCTRYGYEDNTSLENRLKLVDDNKLAGAAFWKLGFENSSVWDTVIKYLD